MFIDYDLVRRMKEQYPPGTRIQLDYMGDDPRPIEPGTKGTVRTVDDMGTVHCNFDNGRNLGLVPGEILSMSLLRETVLIGMRGDADGYDHSPHDGR